MASGKPGIVVDVPAANPARVGSLLASAAPANAQGTDWEAGLQAAPQSCKTGEAQATCNPSTLTVADQPGFIDETAYVIEAGVICSTFGDRTTYGERAINTLLRNSSRLIEQEFELGTIATAEGYNNFFLTDAPDELAVDLGAAAGTAYKVVKGFAGVEELTMDKLGGTRCMIHVPVRVAAYLAFNNLIHQEGNLLLSELGNIVVVGAGYSGASPAGAADSSNATAWIYGTDIVTLYVGQPVLTQDGLSQSLNREINEVEVRAYRYAATINNGCANVAAKLTLEDI